MKIKKKKEWPKKRKEIENSDWKRKNWMGGCIGANTEDIYIRRREWKKLVGMGTGSDVHGGQNNGRKQIPRKKKNISKKICYFLKKPGKRLSWKGQTSKEESHTIAGCKRPAKARSLISRKDGLTRVGIGFGRNGWIVVRLCGIVLTSDQRERRLKRGVFSVSREFHVGRRCLAVNRTRSRKEMAVIGSHLDSVNFTMSELALRP